MKLALASGKVFIVVFSQCEVSVIVYTKMFLLELEHIVDLAKASSLIDPEVIYS